MRPSTPPDRVVPLPTRLLHLSLSSSTSDSTPAARFPLPPRLRETLARLRNGRLGTSAPPLVPSLPGRSPPPRLDATRSCLFPPLVSPVPWLIAASRTLALSGTPWPGAAPAGAFKCV
ncbi:hypothetical protein BDA96_10G196200 [Sorghum bicolor]|uniref:Uncharacterized protein n=1 Tax=Sorghum bicolor TaxID=4558 RepID=A0A921Q2S0_SORBI|nr:hypothetical protein BDA96_10G196200 [Sorghum bicolor]